MNCGNAVNDDAGFGIRGEWERCSTPAADSCLCRFLTRKMLWSGRADTQSSRGTWMAITYKEPICYDVCTRMLLLWLAV